MAGDELMLEWYGMLYLSLVDSTNNKMDATTNEDEDTCFQSKHKKECEKRVAESYEEELELNVRSMPLNFMTRHYLIHVSYLFSPITCR